MSEYSRELGHGNAIPTPREQLLVSSFGSELSTPIRMPYMVFPTKHITASAFELASHVAQSFSLYANPTWPCPCSAYNVEVWERETLPDEARSDIEDSAAHTVQRYQSIIIRIPDKSRYHLPFYDQLLNGCIAI